MAAGAIPAVNSVDTLELIFRPGSHNLLCSPKASVIGLAVGAGGTIDALFAASVQMLGRVKKLYRALLAISQQASQEVLETNLSPIDKYLASSAIVNKSGLFHPTYEGWRVKRLTKILEIYGIDFFKGRRLLEVGAGHGDIGAFFADLGAEVLCLDGRIQNVNFGRLKYRKLPNIRFAQFNLENDFAWVGKFDLLINFGLIYHLRNVEEHLRSCFAVADDILLETVVCDSLDPFKILLREERSTVDEEALEGVGSRPSPFYIERIAQQNGYDITRYFTPDLNFGEQFRYDWQHNNDDVPNDDFVRRRFWRLKRPGAEMTLSRSETRETPGNG